MTTLTIEIPAKSKKEITEIVTQLGGKVISIEKQPKSTSAKKRVDFKRSK